MKKKFKNGKCELCLQDTVLQYSHIIPKFIFKKIKAGSKNFIVISEEKNKAFKSQREYREHLLCLKCERKFHKNETYASNILYNFNNLFEFKNDIVTIHKIDYHKFKLFQLSILWRGAVSKNTAFQAGKIEPNILEKLRVMLFEENPGEEYEFGCIMFGIMLQGRFEIQLLLNPGWFSADNDKIIYYTFGGFRWYFLICEKWESLNVKNHSLGKNGKLTFKLKDLHDFQDFDNLISKSFRLKPRA